ncbi:MAG: TetR/AcrR family transcriptional regulator [Deltaproteobacteria bacterium]|nr:TetR/AcrR family transcriptional regulator [Deltaproteobacteria bacterium]
MEKSKRKAWKFTQRRREILKHSEKIFSSKGYHSATIAEIAGSSGCAVGTIYRIFKGKEHLYTTMVNEKMDRMYSDIRRSVFGVQDVVKKIEALVSAHFRFVENNLEFCNLFIRGQVMTLPAGLTALRDKMIDDYLEHIKFIEDFIRTGFEERSIRAMEARTVAAVLLGIINAYAFNWMMAPDDSRLITKVGSVLDIFFRGVRQDGYQA